MLWYAEQKNIFGGWSAVTLDRYPVDVNSEGQKLSYRVRCEVKPEHAHLSLDELTEIYGTKAEITFKSVRNLAA